jgi:hypothetical protein
MPRTKAMPLGSTKPHRHEHRAGHQESGSPASPHSPCEPPDSDHRELYASMDPPIDPPEACGPLEQLALRVVISGRDVADPARRAGQRPGQAGWDADLPWHRKWPQRLVVEMSLGLHVDLLMVVTSRPGSAGRHARIRDLGGIKLRWFAGSISPKQAGARRGWPRTSVAQALNRASGPALTAAVQTRQDAARLAAVLAVLVGHVIEDVVQKGAAAPFRRNGPGTGKLAPSSFRRPARSASLRAVTGSRPLHTDFGRELYGPLGQVLRSAWRRAGLA